MEKFQMIILLAVAALVVCSALTVSAQAQMDDKPRATARPRVIVTSDGETDNGTPPLVRYQRVICDIK